MGVGEQCCGKDTRTPRHPDTKMDKLNNEDSKKTGAINSIISLCMSIAMLAVGVHYQNPEDEMKKNCEFDAPLFLFIGGILGIIIHGFGVITAVATWCAERDGVVTEGEKCGLNILKCFGGCATFFCYHWGACHPHLGLCRCVWQLCRVD